MTDAGVPSPADVTKLMQSTVPMLGSMGLEAVVVEPRHVRTRLPFSAVNGNHIGTVYAGVLFSLLEASGGALVLVSLDVSRWIPVIVEGTIRYLRPVSGSVDCDLSLTERDVEAVHAALDADPKYRWTFQASAVAEDGRVACEADFVYRFRPAGTIQERVARNPAP